MKQVTILISIIFCWLIISCKKNSNTTSQSSNDASGELILHLHTNVDTTELSFYQQVSYLPGKRTVKVSLAQLYLSNIQLQKADGNWYSIADIHILKRVDTEEYSLGTVPAGNYKSIQFDVGLPAGINSSEPALSDTVLNRPEMWFGNHVRPTAYIFLKFSGRLDTTTNANGDSTRFAKFDFRIGLDVNKKNVVMPEKNFSVLPNQTEFVHITIDYGQLFDNLAINKAINLAVTDSAGNVSPVGKTVAANVPTMFTYEE